MSAKQSRKASSSHLSMAPPVRKRMITSLDIRGGSITDNHHLREEGGTPMDPGAGCGNDLLNTVNTKEQQESLAKTLDSIYTPA